ncbi:AraC family transcriptional regulator [Virgibacillus sp. Bac330]|uniref:AraC family transcriptional regulator n=1 Tax=Virgibacillus sp. Bac330 TaxID=2419841 RepID=UPI001F09A4E7|nr:AraC family transcriptional regulator [Virgibacillus sp. Bac330]
MIQIGYCGYAYHTNGYFATHKNGYDSYLFRLQTEGVSQAVIKDKKIHLEKGDIIFVAPGEYYQLQIEGGQASGDYHIFFSGEWVDQWWNRFNKPTTIKIDLTDKIVSLWRYLIAEKRRPLSDKNDELMGYLFRSLCLLIERAIKDQAAHCRPFVVTKMMRYIEENATTGFTVDDVANHAMLSVSRSVHLFKQYTNKTIIEYAQEIRLAAAIDQMKYTNMTLEHIAENCGFGAYPYFHRVFKKVYGVSPGIYRKTS